MKRVIRDRGPQLCVTRGRRRQFTVDSHPIGRLRSSEDRAAKFDVPIYIRTWRLLLWTLGFDEAICAESWISDVAVKLC